MAIHFVCQSIVDEQRTGKRIDHLHAHFAHDPTLIAYLVHCITGIPFSFTAHARDLYQVPEKVLLDRIQQASAVVTCCRANLNYLERIAPAEQSKAALVYQAIDHSGGFYRGHAVPAARSIMNVPFRMPNEELEDLFVKETKKADLIGLKGHRSVGGLRASLYNALPLESASALAGFMVDFQRKHG